jgi:DnaJ family protein A protein 2
MCDNELYDLLGVEPGCSQDEIKKGFRKMAMKFHPDKNSSDEAEQKFKEINAANEILSDPQKRDQYDKYGIDAFKDGGGGGGADMNDIFSHFFGGGRRQQQRGPKKTKNIEHVIKVSLTELYTGVEKKMKVQKTTLCVPCGATGSTDKKKYDCTVCKGTGTQEILRNFGMGMMRQMIHCQQCGGQGINIPKKFICQSCKGQKTVKTSKIVSVEIEKGSKHGKQIRFAGESDEEPGCQTGDLIFILQEMKHEFFQRDGENLIMQQNIPLVNALTGYSFEVNHLDGKKILIHTPPGMIIQPDAVLEVIDQGMPIYSYPFEHGSLYVKFNVIFPTKIEPDQCDILKSALPGLLVHPNSNADTTKALLQPIDKQRSHDRSQQYRERNAYSSDEEEEHGQRGSNVQCAQQ